MKPSERAKQAGLDSLEELAEMTGQSVQTLNNWSKNKPKLFDVVLAGAVQIKRHDLQDLEVIQTLADIESKARLLQEQLKV